jgi:hypothetical protein
VAGKELTKPRSGLGAEAVASSGESNRAAAAEIKLGKAVHLGGFIVVIAVMEKG